MYLFTTDISAVDTPTGLFWALVIVFGVLGVMSLAYRWASK